MDPAFDLGWFVAPGLLSAMAGLALWWLDPAPREGSMAIWIVGVLLVDVAHVYASLFRTYLDPEGRRHHARRLVAFPLAVFAVGLSLHLISPGLFWRVLAYVAIFHFVKQHEGFAALYLRGRGESAFDVRLGKLAVWAGTLGPVLWWHANLPRGFAWFMDGDLVTGVPPAVGSAALLVEAGVLLAFLVRRIQLGIAGHRNPMVPALVFTTALCWNLGIVWTNDDRIFTITNVFLHGVPYLALVWVAGGGARLRTLVDVAGRPSRPASTAFAWTGGLVALYYGVLVGLALTEETLWDRLVWHDRPLLFGDGQLSLGGVGLALVVALLTVPQATHYLLDRYIWRPGPDNPGLAEALGMRPQDARDRA